MIMSTNSIWSAGEVGRPATKPSKAALAASRVQPNERADEETQPTFGFQGFEMSVGRPDPGLDEDALQFGEIGDGERSLRRSCGSRCGCCRPQEMTGLDAEPLHVGADGDPAECDREASPCRPRSRE